MTNPTDAEMIAWIDWYMSNIICNAHNGADRFKLTQIRDRLASLTPEPVCCHCENTGWKSVGLRCPDKCPTDAEISSVVAKPEHVELAIKELHEMIVGGDECSGSDSQITHVIGILERRPNNIYVARKANKS